jgi:hypothetical protein
MKKIEERAVALVKELVPNFSRLEFWASIGDTSRAVEFFVWIDGERRQNYDLADNREIDEQKMGKLLDDFAVTVRNNEEYKKGEINKISFIECNYKYL